MRYTSDSFDVCVCGGGLAGVSAAIAAARQGARTALIQDRPVLGGNSSSEIRVTPHGAAQFHAYARETGIISELLIEERARNHEAIFENGWTNSVYDLVLYEAVLAEPNLTLYLNTRVQMVEMAGPRQIRAVVAQIGGAETIVTITARSFLDCTGDGTLAVLAGCRWRMGTEGRAEFDEPHAPDEASDAVMGSSIHFKTRDIGRPAPFTPPSWAVYYDDASFFYDTGRRPDDLRGGYWWMEISVPWHTIYDAEDIRFELTRHALGVWDWIKNRDPLLKERASSYVLDWLGQVPGKRESRRIIGRHLMTEHDLARPQPFADEVAYGGWFVDLHTPGGLLAATSEPGAVSGHGPEQARSFVGPYGIPLRALIAQDVDNLLLAGRNISATHVALGSVRVQATTALMGQAAGTAAALGLRQGIPVPELPERAIGAIQQALLRAGCFLPSQSNQDPDDLARAARVSASSADLLHGAGPDDSWERGGLGDRLTHGSNLGDGSLTCRTGQLIAVHGPLAALEVCLSNAGPAPQAVEARLLAVEHIWDYRAAGATELAATTLLVPAGSQQWVRWPLELQLAGPRYLRLDLLPNPAVRWHLAGAVVPGQIAAIELGGGRMRRYADGVTLSFRVAPPQPVFGPANVLSGVNRPHTRPNLWRSDPAQPLPQWLELRWAGPQPIGQVELSFPGQLLREYHAYQPFYRDPQCPRDYTLSAWVEGAWRELVRVEGNYQRRRVHRLEAPVRAERLRLTILATNGDPATMVYEIRCYAAA